MSRSSLHGLWMVVLLAVPARVPAQEPVPLASDTQSQAASEPDPEAAAARLDKIVVTGSHIKRIEIEGPLPISTIDREELLARGEPSLPDALRDLPYNSFGSKGELPNSHIPNASLPSLRGLGSKYTLSLLDGHRLPGFASIDGGAATSLTGIPLAAIDRVEVLRDGASAVYGSDAIGGVVNLLTRRGDTEPQVEFQIEQPHEDGGESRRASLVYGRSFARGHWLLTAEAQDREPLYGADRDYLTAVAPLSAYGNPGTYRRYHPVTEDYVGPNVADPRCPEALDSDPLFPSSTLNFSGTRCLYRFRDLNAERGGYEGRSLFASARYDVADALTGFMRVLLVGADHLTQLAPTPVDVLMAGDSPFNPTRGELGPELGYPLELLYRLTALGPRINTAEEFDVHALFGIDGLLEWAEGGGWSASLTHNRLDYDVSYASGYALVRYFYDTVDDSRFDPFSAAPGNLVGLEGVLYRPWQRDEFRSTLLELAWSLDAGLFGEVTASYAFGLEADRSEYSIEADPELNAGEVLGFFGPIRDEVAARNHAGVYGEMLLPLSPRWELSLAARYDHYQDAGGALSPKLALAFRPGEHWLLRASAGKGFQVPDLVTAYGPGYSFDPPLGLVDQVDCAAHPEDPVACEPRPVTVRVVPNDQLGPEHARQFGVGVVWQPLDGLDLALDYYHTRIIDLIGVLEPDDALELELACLQSGQVCDPLLAGQVIRDGRGNLDTIITPYINVAGVETAGLDFELGAQRSTRFGDFRFDLRASKVLDYDFSLSPDLTFGVVGADGAPPWRAQARLDWQFGDHGLSVGAEYTAERGECRPAILPDGRRNPACEDRIDSHTELDAQWRWKTPWDGEIALGGRNLGSRPPSLNSGGGYQYGLYDPNGRVWYLRYRQTF